MKGPEFRPTPPKTLTEDVSSGFLQQRLEDLRRGTPLPSTDLSPAGQAEAESQRILFELNALGRAMHDKKK